MLTVPLAFRQQEVEREIDDLDRGVAPCRAVLHPAGRGHRPVDGRAHRRSGAPADTRDRRIARGDFDARIAVRSSDELRRLVDAFNGMAAELKAQRDQLERTHRLEAWAEMARQVAHEIKNPLTPIQLSAEHLRRVHTDRGEPLEPRARRLRRHRSSDRSGCCARSPRSSPASPRRRPRAAPRSIRCSWCSDVVEPYRVGAGRSH